VLAGLNFVLGLFVMNETVTAATRRAFSWASANPLGAFRMLGQVPGLKGLLWAYFLYSVAIYVYPAIWAYFSQERFGWSSRMIGLSLGIFGFLMAVVQGGLLPHITRRIGERRTVIWGQLFDFVGFGLLAFIASGTLALILIPITAMGAVVPPALQAIMSRSVADDQQGALQGVMSAVHALSMIVSPLLMASVFARFTGPQAPIYLPGAPFLVALALMAAGLVIFLRTRTAVT